MYACGRDAGERTAALAEQPFALLVNDLPGLGDRERDRGFSGRMHFGADEAVLFEHASHLFFDNAAGLVLPLAPVRRWPDAIAVIFSALSVGDCGVAEQTIEKRLQHRFIVPPAGRLCEQCRSVAWGHGVGPEINFVCPILG